MTGKCPEHNSDCGSPKHEDHLCYFVSQGFHITEEEEYNWLVSDPKFKCKRCGRVARCAENLCLPVNL